jgi:diguanylate cyclase (GGDEF)-like protein
VRPFVDGREALEHIKGNLDVDVLMANTEPDSLSGVELCWETRVLANGGRPIHIILMSSTCDQKHLIQALDCGADDFISKPPAVQELYARLRCAERLLSMQRDLVRLAATDALTGMLNRRAFLERAQSICERAADGGTLSAIMLDIDHFKAINDECGHEVGDQTLCAVASELAGRHAVVGRLGGEEFAILLEGDDLAAAVAAAERLRAAIAALRLQIGPRSLTITCSFGVSEWRNSDGIEQLLKCADLALYKAKHGGRNRVVGGDAESMAKPSDNRGSVIRAFGRA